MSSFIKSCFCVCLLVIFSCSPSDVDFSCFHSRYTSRELAFFLETGFYTEQLVRWDKDIRIKMLPPFSDEDSANLDSLILEFQPLLKKIRIQRVELNPNVTIQIKPLGWQAGLTVPRKNLFRYTLIGVQVFLESNLSSFDRRLTMRHEFMHVLGLTHADTTTQVIMGKSYFSGVEEYEKTRERYRKISGLDSMSVVMLYDSCMPVGASKKEFDKYVRAHVKRETPIHPFHR